MTQLARPLLATVLAVLGGLSLSAQHSGGEGEAKPFPTGCYCSAEGADCPFGSGGDCHVSRCPGACECNAGDCVLGFPRGARCECHAATTLTAGERSVRPTSHVSDAPAPTCDTE